MPAISATAAPAAGTQQISSDALYEWAIALSFDLAIETFTTEGRRYWRAELSNIAGGTRSYVHVTTWIEDREEMASELVAVLECCALAATRSPRPTA